MAIEVKKEKKKEQKTCLPRQEIQEMQVRSQGREDLLEEGMATHPTIPAWRNPWTEKPGRLWSIELKRVEYN